MGGAAGGVLLGVGAAEVCAPLLLLCWLCCWPDEPQSDVSSESHPTRPVVAREAGSRRRSSEFFGRRLGSSALSLHLPSTSGHKKQPLSAHRSHEEIVGRRPSQLEPADARYHSAPSVIHEVLHRRDWDRSAKELHIPLKPATSGDHHAGRDSDADSDVSSGPPHAEPESSSIEELKPREPAKPCKKHYTNIKSSRGKKKGTKDDRSVKEIASAGDDKDSDVTESNFYIGESNEARRALEGGNETPDAQKKSMYRAKEAKQNFNESLKSRERPWQTLGPVDEHHPRLFQFSLDDVIEQMDRSGALHHSLQSRQSAARSLLPPPSAEAVDYEWEAEAEAEWEAEAGARCLARPASPAAGARRARHASDGDILAPSQRPESGAFSESELDLELEASEERPPAYHELPPAERRETAI